MSGIDYSSINKKINDRIQVLAEKSQLMDGSGRNEYMNELFTLVMPKLRFQIWKFFHNDVDTDDVLHNTLQKICENIMKYNSMYRFTTWSFSIAKNEALLYIQERKKFSNTVEFDTVLYKIDRIDVSKESAECDTDMYKMYEKLYAEIMLLDIDVVDNRIFVQKEINGMKVKDLASYYSINEDTIKTKLRSVRLKLRESMISKHPNLCKRYKVILNFAENNDIDGAMCKLANPMKYTETI